MNLPLGIGGIDACRKIRGISRHAGIILVRVRDLENDKVRRLRAVLRRDTVLTSDLGSGVSRTYIRMLRKKIEVDAAKPQYILAEWWLGYRFYHPSDSD
jgi:DNA-binding response OmpR family regulator